MWRREWKSIKLFDLWIISSPFSRQRSHTEGSFKTLWPPPLPVWPMFTAAAKPKSSSSTSRTDKKPGAAARQRALITAHQLTDERWHGDERLRLSRVRVCAHACVCNLCCRVMAQVKTNPAMFQHVQTINEIILMAVCK